MTIGLLLLTLLLLKVQYAGSIKAVLVSIHHQGNQQQ